MKARFLSAALAVSALAAVVLGGAAPWMHY